MQSVVRVHDLVKRHASLGSTPLLRAPFEKLLERGAHLLLRAKFDKIRTLCVEPCKKDSLQPRANHPAVVSLLLSKTLALFGILGTEIPQVLVKRALEPG